MQHSRVKISVALLSALAISVTLVLVLREGNSVPPGRATRRVVDGDTGMSPATEPAAAPEVDGPAVPGADATSRPPRPRRVKQKEPPPAAPPGHRPLTDLAFYDDKSVPAERRVREIVQWLRDEVANPRPTTRGLGGGAISTGYVRLQLVKAMAFVGNPDRVSNRLAGKPNSELADWFRDALGSGEESGSEVRDWLTIALGMAGDRRVEPGLLKLLRDSQDGYLRASAAEALHDVGSEKAIPALEAALDDSFHVKAYNCTRADYTEYPVRSAARGALFRIRSRTKGLKAPR